MKYKYTVTYFNKFFSLAFLYSAAHGIPLMLAGMCSGIHSKQNFSESDELLSKKLGNQTLSAFLGKRYKQYSVSPQGKINLSEDQGVSDFIFTGSESETIAKLFDYESGLKTGTVLLKARDSIKYGIIGYLIKEITGNILSHATCALMYHDLYENDTEKYNENLEYWKGFWEKATPFVAMAYSLISPVNSYEREQFGKVVLHGADYARQVGGGFLGAGAGGVVGFGRAAFSVAYDSLFFALKLGALGAGIGYAVDLYTGRYGPVETEITEEQDLQEESLLGASNQVIDSI
ncbi:MAG: hypothetical protein SFT93_02295 [Rickettsiaceae bacterium]|nr:hypothetical protein [Rickettsiaceae bacterium]